MRDLQRLTSLDSIDEFIQEHQLAFLFISQPNCSVCRGLFPQIQKLLEKYPKIKLGLINTEDIRDIAGRFSVFTVPVLLLFVNGKEYIREARIVHTHLLDKKMKKIYEIIT